MNEKVTCAECKHFNAETNYCKRIENTVRPRYGCYEGENRIVTNGDKIRAMSNEELAENRKFWHGGGCPKGSKSPCRSKVTCNQCWLNWLNAEAKEEV